MLVDKLRERYATGVLVVLVYGLVVSQVPSFVVWGVPLGGLVDPSNGLPLVIGALLGPGAPVAAFLGYLLGIAVIGPVDVFSVFVALAHFSIATIGYQMLGRNGIDVTSPRTGWIWRLVTTVLVTSAIGGSVVAWGSEVAGMAPFYLATATWTLEFFLTGTVASTAVIGWRVYSDTRTTAADGRRGGQRIRPTAVGLLAITWIAVGSVFSLGYRQVEVIPLFSTIPAISVFTHDVWGVGGARIQVVLGGVLFAGVLIYLFLGEDRWAGGDRRWN